MPATFKYVPNIPTGELRLLLKNAEANGFGDTPHAQAYRVELEKREKPPAK